MLKNELLYPTAATRYLEERQSRIRGRDTRRGILSLTARLQAAHPNQRVCDFTEAQLVTFLNTPGWAPASVARYRSLLVQLFRWATRQGLCEKDPAAYLSEIVNPRAHRVRPPTWLEDEEIREILTLPAADVIGIRDRLALAIPIYTGLRVEEFAAPPRNQPDRGLVWGRVRRDSIRVLGKGEKWDTVGVNPALATLLTEWRALCETGLGRPVGLHDPVLCRSWEFGGEFGSERQRQLWWNRGLGPGGIRDMVHAYGARVGYPELAPHDLRRTFAYSLKRAGVPIEDISLMMRHENIATTVRYLKHDKSALAGHWAKVGAGA